MLTRSRMASVFELADELGPYDFWPIIPAGTDPQFHASLNDCSQPFHSIHSHDAVLIHLAGSGKVEFAEGSVRWHALVPGDYVYLPAGLPYRVVVDELSLQILIRAESGGTEGVAWYCEACGALVCCSEFDSDAELLQRGFHRLAKAFNDDTSLRTCQKCGAVHRGVELEKFRWLEIAEMIEAQGSKPDPEPVESLDD